MNTYLVSIAYEEAYANVVDQNGDIFVVSAADEDDAQNQVWKHLGYSRCALRRETVADDSEAIGFGMDSGSLIGTAEVRGEVIRSKGDGLISLTS